MTSETTAREVFDTTVDFLAAALFVVGSLLFFNEATFIPGTWCYLLGSVGFGVRPTLRLVAFARGWWGRG